MRADDGLVALEIEIAVDGERPREIAIGRVARVEVGQSLDDDEAGDLSAFVAAHAVGEHEESRIGKLAERVFVRARMPLSLAPAPSIRTMIGLAFEAR